MANEPGQDKLDDLVFVGELNSLGDAHLVSAALNEAGIAYRVVENVSHAFDLAIPHGWGNLYADPTRVDDVQAIVAQVREDEALIDAQPDTFVDEEPEFGDDEEPGFEGAGDDRTSPGE